jgi:protocatechuate 3,4-dioxygenase beta subunit
MSHGNTLAGRVVWPDGQPAVGAKVLAIEHKTKNPRRPWEDWSQKDTTADGDGRFALGGMEAASVSVTAKVQVEGAQDGHSPGTWSARRADVEFGAELLLTLEAPHAVRGRVVDDRGTPLAKFVVEMNSTDEGGPSTSQSKPFEAADGAFELQLAAGTYTLSAAADEHGKSEDQSVTLPGTAEVLTFTVPRATSISGTVLDPAGAPIAGASVEIDNEGGRRGMRMARLPDADGSSNKSDEQGHFTLKRIPPGNVALTATLHDFAPSEAQTVAVVAGQPVADVQLKLRLGGRLEGEIYAASGAPDPGRQIMVGNFAGGGGSMDGNATSDSAGHFVVEHVVPGKHNVMAVP